VTLLLALASLGIVLTAGSAYAGTPLASLTAIVNPPPQNSLLSLCVTSHSLDPNGTCLTVPPANAGGITPGASAGQVTVTVSGSRYSAGYLSVGPWKFTGAFVIGTQAFVGEVDSRGSGTGPEPGSQHITPFQISGSSAGSTLSGTCRGSFVDASVDGRSPASLPPVSFGATPSVVNLFCTASIGAGPPGDFQLLVVLPIGTDFGGPPASFFGTDYTGAFVGVGAVPLCQDGQVQVAGHSVALSDCPAAA
jgi:hypothetical protein